MGIKERKKREKDERKASILNAAMQVYAEVGYHATTMEKIAARAELSRATLYLYFKTKDEIFVHAIVSRSDYFGDLLQYIYDHREESKDRIFFLEKLPDLLQGRSGELQCDALFPPGGNAAKPSRGPAPHAGPIRHPELPVDVQDHGIRHR
ncbi:MAG: helix-turn-helix transcriptional regulator [Deltaproteobacteria bacterium]|nr:helix-turn-helix transcriptional regulator [Deltaproteobacteria bacterium]